MSFRNPVGLATGFDKNALYLKELDALGFGFTEIGTVTPVAQAVTTSPGTGAERQSVDQPHGF